MKSMNVKKGGGFYYHNEFWYSPAYQSLPISARELLHCLLTEYRFKYIRSRERMKRDKVYLNNGDLSYTEVQFKKRYGYSSSTYLKARDKLIEVGLIVQTHKGGMCRGDRATYKLLVDISEREERWRQYPERNWADEIPKPKKQMVGVKTQWKKGKSGRKIKATLLK